MKQLTVALGLMALGANAQNIQPAPAAPVQRFAPAATPGTQPTPGLLPGQLPAQKTVPAQRQENFDQRNFPPPDVGTNGAASVPRNGAGTNQVGQSPFGANTNGEIATTNGFDRDDRRFAGTNQNGTTTNAFGTLGNGVTNGLVQDQGTTAQDRALLAQIRQALLPEIRHERVPIHLIAQNGVVTMLGFVPNEEESQEFVNLVLRIPGVVSVVNNLHVAQSGTGAIIADQAFTDHDRALLGHVRGEMQRRHSGAGATESVHVVSRDGVVTLYGFVASTADEQSLLAVAQSTPGVVQVVDKLRVRASGSGRLDADDIGRTQNAGSNSDFAIFPNTRSTNNNAAVDINTAGTAQSAAQAASAPSVSSAPTNSNVNASSVGTTLSPTSRSNAPSSIFTINTNGPGLSR